MLKELDNYVQLVSIGYMEDSPKEYKVVYRCSQTDEIKEESFYGSSKGRALKTWKKINKITNKGRLISIHYVRNLD